MPASLHDWVERLKSQPLPAMAFTQQRVSALMARPSSTHADYQRIIARDPGFALSVFRHLGALRNPPREPITTLAHALALAGTAPLEAGVKNLPCVKSLSDTTGSRQGLLACYSRAVHAAMYLYQWGEIRNDPNPEELLLAALLHDCGEMALWSAAPDQMAAVESRATRGLNRENAALAVFGFTPIQLSLGLAESWGLPPLIGDSISPDGAFRPRPLGVMLACELAHWSASAWDSEQTMELIELAAEYCRKTTDQTAAALHAMSAETARRLEGFNLPVSATALVSLQPKEKKTPQCSPEQVRYTAEALTRSSPSPEAVKESAPPASALAEKKVPQIAQVETDMEVTPEPDPKGDYRETNTVEIPLVKSRPDQENNDPPTAQQKSGDSLQMQLTRSMKQLRDNTGLERAMFAMMTPDRKTLRARFILGAEKDAAIKTFQVTLDKRHLFSVLLSKPQNFWLNLDNRSKYLPAIPIHTHNALNTQGFFISSLFVADKAVGILYADSSNTANLNGENFTIFKQLSQQLSTELSNFQKVRAAG